MQKNAVDILTSYVDALHPIIYINHFDFKVIDDVISKVSEKAKKVEFNNALGFVDFQNKHPMLEASLESFLKQAMDYGFDRETFVILKAVHTELKKPKVIALLKKIAEDNVYREGYRETVFIVSEVLVIPEELENLITIFDVPLPDLNEIKGIVADYAKDLDIKVESDVVDEIALSFKGLNEFQIQQTKILV